MEVLVDDGVEKLRIVVFFNAEGLSHKCRVEVVLFSKVLQLLVFFLADCSVLYFLEVAENVCWTFLHVFALLFHLLNGSQIRKLD